MKHYKKLLENLLTRNGWRVEQINSHASWWIEESWNIRSIEKNWGKALVIAFLRHFYSESASENDYPSVYKITANLEMPVNPENDGLPFASMRLDTGNFHRALADFMAEINQFREH